MSKATNTDSRGRFCGRAVHGVSNLSHEDMRQIEAHRAKERPTPWAHLAMRYRVNEIDLRRLCDPLNDNRPEPVKPAPVREALTPAQMLPPLWEAGLPVDQISNILKIDARSVSRLRERLGLPARKRGAQ